MHNAEEANQTTSAKFKLRIYIRTLELIVKPKRKIEILEIFRYTQQYNTITIFRYNLIL